MSGFWKDAAELLRKAADTIDARGRLRDAEGEPDLVDVTAQIADVPPDTVLDVLVALKVARFDRAHDFDSAVDWLAYLARKLASEVAVPKAQKPSPLVPFDPAEQFDDEPPTRAGTAMLPDRH
jgi:hypothetical protein